MEIFYGMCFFVIGIFIGSFYNVVGYRIPKGESILYPSSHCTKCNHNLKFYELIPIFSFIFLGGKCIKCKTKISWFYPIFEFITGLAFLVSYMIFGMSLECLYSIIFLSMLIIIIISDYQTMIIPDSILLFFLFLLMLLKYFMYDIEMVGIYLLHGLGSFIFLLLIKILGDFLFKKESMGGGDIKLLGVFGFVLGMPLSIISVFLAALIALPISLIILKINKTHEIPFGPFLAISAIILFLSQIDINTIIKFLTII